LFTVVGGIIVSQDYINLLVVLIFDE
jgi:hypothetical protein